MISQYDVIKSFKNAEEKGLKLSLKLSDDKKNLIDSETGEFVATLKEFTTQLRKDTHCDFETIYYEHVSLDEVLRCRQCGTVIFSGDDEWRYDPKLRCPTCCNDSSVCHNEYWTKEQIESDFEKQKTIEALIAEQKYMDEAAKRKEARGGLYDWQRWQKKFYTKTRDFEITLINDNWNRQCPLKHTNRYLEIHSWRRSDGIVKHHWQIPLSWHFIYIKWIYPYKKKCHPSVRKYHFWQKKPKEVA